MKYSLLLPLLVLPITVFALENTNKERQCLNVNESITVKSCLIVHGTGTDAEYVELNFSKKVFFIEKPIICYNTECDVRLGDQFNHLKVAEVYYLSEKNKKQTTRLIGKYWTCYKQIDGKINVCYREK